MNLRFGLILAGLSLLPWLEGPVLSAPAGSKPIRLRNQPPPTQPREVGQNDAVSGLILVQFNQPVEPAWSEQLRTLGVELLRYVPEDAFVARCRATPLARIRELPFVQFVGPYHLEHKVHPKLLRGAGPANPQTRVTILLAPDATAADLAGVKARLEVIQQESRPRFGPVVRGGVAPGQWERLVESPAVLWIEPAPVMKLRDEVSAKIVGGSVTNGGTFTQQLGFDGRGVTVAVADSGLHSGDTNSMHPDLAGRVTRQFAYGNLANAADRHGHGTHVTGIIAGGGVIETLDGHGNRFGLGVASRASIVVQRVFDGAGGFVLDDSFAKLTDDAWAAGAEIGSNSWGEDTEGRYDVAAAEFDELVRDASSQDGDQGYLLIFSVGNAGPGPQTIGSPAVAKNVIAVGASQNDRAEFSNYPDGHDAMADFSSRGPCEDGRIKPDLVAPGTWIASLRSLLGNDRNAWQPIDEDYAFMGGTSQAAPHVAGAAAVFSQYYRVRYASGSPSPALIKAALIHSAIDMPASKGTGPAPNMAEGWGRPDLTELVGSPRTHVFIDQSCALATGQACETNLIIASREQPLKVTMTYTDVAGFPAALPTLVNDLDLEVLAPDGRIYRGNQFEGGRSVANAPANDSVNNVESVLVPDPIPGEYRIRVQARRVITDACAGAIGTNQDFALVICGAIPSPEAGVVLVDRAYYTAPGRIQIRLFDLDLEGQPWVLVKVSSRTEHVGQAVSLTAEAGAGAFSGSILTARGDPAADGRLQIAHGDWIRLEYFDESEHRTNAATAEADLEAPSLLDVLLSEQFGRTKVTWQTLEPATSSVRYGTNPNNLTQLILDPALTTSHALELTNLVASQTYFLEVSSKDSAGNAATNSFSFVATLAKTVLLVDDYLFEPGDVVLIERNSYTDPLDQAGVSYDVWTPVERGHPAYEDLRAYQIVIWRINDSVHSTTSIARPQLEAITQYIQSGGAFFMASMQILTRLSDQGDEGFIRNVLNIDRFLRSPDPAQHCTDCDEDFQVPAAQGIANDLIGDGLQFNLNYGAYPNGDPLPTGPDFADTFGCSTNATAFLIESRSGKACGLHSPPTGQDSPGRLVFVSFPLDAVPEVGPGPNNRAEFLRRVLQFLSPGLGGRGTIAFHRNQYRIPDLVTIEVADSDLAGQPSLTVQVSSTTVPDALPVILRETPRPGLFRGSVPLVSASNQAGQGHLRAFDGDSLYARYLDASAPSPVQTSALVDTVTPVIFALEVLPGFTEATLRWETDEPTDALVQFGESVFLGRTAYSPVLEYQHTVTFTGLVPDRGYFFKIVSRDAAGNATEEDKDINGRRFTFDTLSPRPLPYLNDLESGSNGWRVVTVAGTEFGWQLAKPQNGFVSSAHSPLHAWASSPLGDPASQIDSSLISPAIDLEGGNVATLRFWHAHDFRRQTSFDLSETGTLLVVTNPLSPPVLLAQYTGTNSGWEEQVIDLTPYIGRAIFLIWHHRLDSYEPWWRPGWAVDDISITIQTLAPGTIQVSNNLAQARVSLTGPTARTAQGTLASFGNLPPGRYVIAWSPAPFYRTPLLQTTNLTPGGMIKLSGVYTFPDINNNQMSDFWETNFFNEVSPARKWFTDTDTDGFTDYAEFTAGTDPTQPNSRLRLLTPGILPAGPRLQVQWPSVPGRAYRLEGSSNLVHWVAFGGWTQAVSTLTSRSLPLPATPLLFRVSVQP